MRFSEFRTCTPENTFPASRLRRCAGRKAWHIFGDRDDYRWQLALGVEFFRFNPALLMRACGLKYHGHFFTNDWFALEGNPSRIRSADLRSGTRKIFWRSWWNRLGSRRDRFNLGGISRLEEHLQPQTADNGRNVFPASRNRSRLPPQCALFVAR